MSAPGHLLRPDPWETAHEHLEARRSEVDKTRKSEPVHWAVLKVGGRFAGLSIEEAAVALDISRATASRHWTYARAWLRDTVSPDKAPAVAEARTSKKSHFSIGSHSGEGFGFTATQRGRGVSSGRQ